MLKIKESWDKMRAVVTGDENKTSGTQWFWRWLFYIMGLSTLALGLILNTKAQLGVSPIISVAYSTSVIAGWNFGNATLVLYVLFVIAEFVLKGKNRQWIDVFQIVLSVLFTRVINIFDRYIDLDLSYMWQKLLVLLAAIVCTGIGAAVSVNMKFVPNPGDGIVAAVADRIHRKMGITKNIFDVCCIVCTVIISLVFEGHLVGIGIGTICAMILVGRVIALFNHFLLIPMANVAGLAVPDQYLDMDQLEELDEESRADKI